MELLVDVKMVIESKNIINILKENIMSINIDNFVWSFSRLNSFHGCKHAWYKSYVLKEKGVSNSFATYGTLVHQLFEDYTNGKFEVYELVDEFEKQYDSNVWDFPPNKYVDLCESYRNQGIEYFTSFEGFDEYNIIGTEKKINFEIEGYKFVGYIDSLMEDEYNNMIVQDYKSKASFKSKKEKMEYTRQLYLYSVPLIEEYKKNPSKLIFNMFRKQKIEEIPFNIKDFEEAKKWALDTIESVSKEEEFPATVNDFFCSQLCNFRYECEERLK